MLNNSQVESNEKHFAVGYQLHFKYYFQSVNVPHKTRSVTNCVSNPQPAAPRSVSTAGVSRQTVASVREAGAEMTVPAV